MQDQVAASDTAALEGRRRGARERRPADHQRAKAKGSLARGENAGHARLAANECEGSASTTIFRGVDSQDVTVTEPSRFLCAHVQRGNRPINASPSYFIPEAEYLPPYTKKLVCKLPA